MMPLTLAIPAPIPMLPMPWMGIEPGWLLIGSIVVGFIAWAVAAARAQAVLKRQPRPVKQRPPATFDEHRSLAA